MADIEVRKGDQIDLVIGKSKSPIDLSIDKQSGTSDYNALTGKPKINDVIVKGEKVGSDYSLQDLLVAGENIQITDNGDHTATIEVIGGTGSGELSADLTVSNPIGRFMMDEVLVAGTSFETLFRGLLSKTYYPTLTDPSVSMSYSVASLVKVGATISGANATLTFNRGQINPQYTSESQYRSGEATGYSASLSGASIEWSKSQDSNVFNVPSFTRNSKGNVVLNASVSYGAGVQPKDSDGNNYQSPLPAGSKNTSKTIEFILPFYYGKNENATISTLDGMTEDLTKKSQKVYTYNVNNEYMYIAYDSSYGNLTSILDENNFENIDSWVKSSVTYQGQNYSVYRSGFAITGSNVKFTFKF